MPIDSFSGMIDSLIQLTFHDCWCVYKPSGPSDLKLLSNALVNYPPLSAGEDNEHFDRESTWLSEAFKYCEYIITPGGDGRYVDVWTPEEEPTASWLEGAIASAEVCLDQIEASRGLMTYDDFQLLNVVKIANSS